ncbi:Uncharacterised protein [Leminorella richardii]|uniref:Uncharacterized protein n=1 Tax=Leminorella richardii TaxID=158841 RepID=A0A2X4URZ0_9GAMM|nr:hypothetical protein [Leminorella richardii]SQI41581.1 Uncharacterised protein [Leminorella richardii]
MTAEEFVKEFWLLKESDVNGALDFNNQRLTSRLVENMGLTDVQHQQLREVLDAVLTDTLYTILLGLDGETHIGEHQISYRIHDEDNNEITGGNIEAYAYEYFHEKGCS